MQPQLSPQSYVAGEYMDYQGRYRNDMRESDRRLLELIGTIAEGRAGSVLQLLDVGCHCGNLLRHIQKAFPGIGCTGVDVFADVVDACRSAPDLAGCSFDVGDVRSLVYAEKFDIITVSAVLCRFDDDDFRQAMASLHGALRPGGYLLAFEWFSPTRQHLSIIERTPQHPEGLCINFRPLEDVLATLSELGYAAIEFSPFQIGIDLPKPDDPSDLTTYTLRTADGQRLNFRGVLYQPWYHLQARRER